MRTVIIYFLIAFFLCSSSGVADTIHPGNPQIEIRRKATGEGCTMGYLAVNGEIICYTLELPWLNNKNDISSIPNGHYNGYIRADGTKGWRIELYNVPDRKSVQIHIGNYTDQTTGCTLVGKRASLDQCAVFESQKAMNSIREKIEPLLNNRIEVVYSGF